MTGVMQRRHVFVERLGWIGGGLLGLSTLGVSFGHLGTVLIFCWLTLSLGLLRLNIHWRETATLILLIFSVYLSLLALAALFLHPGYAPAIVDGYWYYLRIPLTAIPLAYWLSQDLRRIYFLLILLGGGLVGRILLHMEINMFTSPAGERYGFGFSIIVFGLYTATAILGLLLMGNRLLILLKHRSLAWLASIIIVLCVILFSYALFLTYSRAAWISFALVAPASLVALSLLKWRGKGSSRNYLIGSFLVCLCVLTLVWLKLPDIQQRLVADDTTIAAVLSGQWEDLPPDSVGLRMHMAIYGVERFMERPLTGWGPGSSRPLLDAHETLHDSRNVHNAYVHLLMELGVLGFCMIIFLLGYLLLRLVKIYRCGLVSVELLVWLWGATIMLALWSVTVVRFDKSDGRFYLIILLAIFLSLHYAGRRLICRSDN